LVIRKVNDTVERVRINDPMRPGKNGQPRTIGTGTHAVTISTGPSFDSEREAGMDLADALIGNLQQIAALVGPQQAAKLMAMGIRMKNLGPIGDEIADLLSPPEPKGPDGQPMPAQLSPQAQQALQENQALKQQLQQAMEMIKGEVIKRQADLESDQAKFQHEIEIQRMKDATSLATAKLQLVGKGVLADAEAEDELVALHAAQSHEMAMAAAGQAMTPPAPMPQGDGAGL
jgi:hypothetical protein